LLNLNLFQENSFKPWKFQNVTIIKSMTHMFMRSYDKHIEFINYSIDNIYQLFNKSSPPELTIVIIIH